MMMMRTRATKEIFHATVTITLASSIKNNSTLSRPKPPQIKGKRLKIRKFGSMRKLAVNERPRTAIVLTSDDDLSLEESRNCSRSTILYP